MKKLLLALPLSLLLTFSFVATSNASIFYVWADTIGDGAKDLLLGSIAGYEGTKTGKNNYDYFSYSGHPVNGPNPKAKTLKMFVYERTTNGRDFLNIIGGKDNAGPNRWQPFSLNIDIFGSSLDPHKVQGDERKEFKETSEDHFEGDWSFKKNSDGGVIGGLLDNWEARITLGEDILKKQGFYSSNGEHIILDDSEYYHYFISKTGKGEPQTDAIPEPATLLLLGSGLLGAFARNRKKLLK